MLEKKKNQNKQVGYRTKPRHMDLHKELLYNCIGEQWMEIELELNRELPNDSHPSRHA